MTRQTLPILAWLAAVATGCANYADQLSRAEHHYQNARYEAALANLEDLEVHVPALSLNERVRYNYVRGMTHLRLDEGPSARHYLAIAREQARNAPSALTDEARQTIDRRITELDPLNPQPTTPDGAQGAGGAQGGASGSSGSGSSGSSGSSTSGSGSSSR